MIRFNKTRLCVLCFVFILSTHINKHSNCANESDEFCGAQKLTHHRGTAALYEPLLLCNSHGSGPAFFSFSFFFFFFVLNKVQTSSRVQTLVDLSFTLAWFWTLNVQTTRINPHNSVKKNKNLNLKLKLLFYFLIHI